MILKLTIICSSDYCLSSNDITRSLIWYVNTLLIILFSLRNLTLWWALLYEDITHSELHFNYIIIVDEETTITAEIYFGAVFLWVKKKLCTFAPNLIVYKLQLTLGKLRSKVNNYFLIKGLKVSFCPFFWLLPP